ncbi:MAG: squalene/phytoene synthase family protein [Deltaproteobacteria bacterium]|nr:MAG: squalene/phytoene synthase family protein [Deltaproteobacteria bacterium]
MLFRKRQKGAILLGKAFQLTNIIRDVGGDLKRDRIYLPAEDMKKFSVKEEDILAKKMTPNLLALLSFESARAEDLYQRAFATIPKDELKKMKSALVMNAVYHKILKKLQKRTFLYLKKSFAEYF